MNPQIKVDDGRKINKSGMLKVTQIQNPIQSNEFRLNSSHTNKKQSDSIVDSPKSIKTKLLEKESKSQVDDQILSEISKPHINEKDCKEQVTITPKG